MRLSKNWLTDFVDIGDMDAAKLGSLLTMATAEIEEVIPWGHGLGEIRAGRVLEVEKHPDADRLRVAQVEVAGEVHNVVCGAPNCAAGITVPVALPGSRLPDGTKIKRSKIRGVKSEGMLCSARELGLGDDHAGLMLLDAATETGCPLPEVFPLEDVVIDIDNKSLTHRPDLWGHYGFAREIACVLGKELRPLALASTAEAAGGIPVSVENTELCPRYLALSLQGLEVKASPHWLQNRLAAVGLRPISNIVDFTNYVMLEIGQPMHAFDLGKVKGARIVVRTARAGEGITTLDGVERELTASTLIIADESDPVAIAGVMGGADSEISDSTETMILESASFDPVCVRRTANRLGLRTDAATRFEKSLDPEFARIGVQRFVQLCEDLVPGVKIGAGYTDAYVGAPEPTRLTIRLDKIQRRLGTDVSMETVTGYFRGLEFGTEVDGDSLTVTVPSFRATKDITIEEDLVEEVGRLFGYDNIEETPLRVICEPPARDPMRLLEDDTRSTLAGGLGYDEVMLYSFLSDEALPFDVPDRAYRVLKNPIAKNQSRMRRSLVPALLGILPANLRNEHELRLFELGRVYHPAEGGNDAREERELGLVFCRRAVGKKARRGESEAPFRALQGTVEALLHRLAIRSWTLEENPADGAPWVHPTRSARIAQEDLTLGLITQIHPGILKQLKIEAEAAIATLTMESLLAATREPAVFTPIPRFPASYKDLAVVVNESTTVREVETTIVEAGGKLATQVRLFDVYRGKPIPDGQKNLAFEIVYQAPDRTLRDDEVGDVHGGIVAAVEGKGWQIRR